MNYPPTEASLENLQEVVDSGQKANAILGRGYYPSCTVPLRPTARLYVVGWQ